MGHDANLTFKVQMFLEVVFGKNNVTLPKRLYIFFIFIYIPI